MLHDFVNLPEQKAGEDGVSQREGPARYSQATVGLKDPWEDPRSRSLEVPRKYFLVA